ncbi:MAG: hypothetical protein ABH952_07805 [Candidatus Omnitrophota bacterium]
MNIRYLKALVAVIAIVLLASMSVCVSAADNLFKVSGKIVWVDLKLGKLQLQSDTFQGRGMGITTVYRINQNDTRVTDSTDKKFLTIDDLRAGQYVKMEVKGGDGKRENIVQNIIAEPLPMSRFQEAFGDIEAIDVIAGTLVILEKPRNNEKGISKLTYFVFEPRDIIFMQSPSEQPIQLELQPGDSVKVDFVVQDGKRQAQSITRYLQGYTTSTTTTTTTTTVK